MFGKWFLFLLSLAIVNTERNQLSILKYKNYTIPDIDYACSNFEITANISEKCGEQLKVICGNTTLFGTMLDATSKFPYTGLGYTSRMDYGNFDQCMTIDHTYEGGRILGKHCTLGLLIPDIFGNISDPTSMYQLSICKPDACSAKDFTLIASDLLEDLPIFFQDSLCQTIETGRTITASDIITILIFAIVILLMILSTTYDFYLSKTQSDNRRPLLLAFSVISNGRKLFQVSKNSKEQIQTLQGLKAISMMWIVAGHGFGIWQVISITNIGDTVKWMNSRYSMYISTAPLSVDTFFFVSGFLLAYQYLKQKASPLKTQLSSIPQMYLHRYLRLTPAMLMIFLVTISIFKYFGSGPLWIFSFQSEANICTDNWWAFFLYIQNFVTEDTYNMCLAQTWYLSADMQMFIISPLLLIPLCLNVRKSPGFKMCMIGLLILSLVFIALPITINLLATDSDHSYHVYERLINYLIGISLGTFMRIKQDKLFLYMVKNSNRAVVNLLVWIVILLGMLAILFCSQEVDWNHGYESKTVFHALMRPAWCIGLSWIVYSCYHGHGGFVNWLLSGPLMQVMGRLTYCIYLLHITVLSLYLASLRNKLYFSDYIAFYTWCGHFTVSTILAIFWTLAFESPIIIIEKQFFGRSVQTKEPQPVHWEAEAKTENVH